MTTLKQSLAVYSSIFFSIVFGLVAFFVFLLFAQFRKEEFRDRLREKALTSIRLLTEVKEIDKQLLQLIDKNTINELYDEKTLIFDEKQQLIYSSVDDVVIHWTKEDLVLLKKKETFHKKQGEYEVYGYFYDSKKVDYYVLIAAQDKYGNRKLQYLSFLLVSAFLISSLIVWFFTYYLVKKLIKPLDTFVHQITAITENNFNANIEESNQKNEIGLMIKAFNQMLQRIEEAYNKQREFTSNASHELRTPIARILSQLQNLQAVTVHNHQTQQYLQNIQADALQMSDLIHSLLLLSKANPSDYFNDSTRIDELLFEVIESISTHFKDLKVNFIFLENSFEEFTLNIPCNEALLRIAFSNLLKNAYSYSSDHKVAIEIEQVKERILKIRFVNQGAVLNPEEQARLFQPFMRGKNAIGKQGIGLGLRIAQRILQHHKASLNYYTESEKWNIFEVSFEI